MYDLLERPTQLILKVWDGIATEQEQLELRDWIMASDDNRSFVEQFSDERWVRSEVKVCSEINVEQALAESWARIKKSKKIFWIRTRIVAAAVLLVIGAGWWLWENHFAGKRQASVAQTMSTAINKPGSNKAKLTLPDGSSYILQDQDSGLFASSNELQFYNSKGHLVCKKKDSTKITRSTGYYTVEVPLGGQYQIHLPDGSLVRLNSASTLTFSPRDTGVRRVTLIGEGYFKVHSDLHRPFIVKVNNNEFEATGTEFNIYAYREEGIVKTTLLEGRLSAVTKSGISKVLPGQSVLILEDKTVVVYKERDPENTVAWTKGDFNWNNENVTSVVYQLARWYNMKALFIDTPKTNVTYRDSRLRQIDTIVSNLNSPAVQIDIRNDTLVVRRR